MTQANIPSIKPQTKEEFDKLRPHQERIRTNVDWGSGGSVTHVDGVAVVSTRQQNSGRVTVTDHDDRIVTVNGATMTRTQYNRLVEDKAIPPGAKVIDRAPHLSGFGKRPFDVGSEGSDTTSAAQNSGDGNADDADGKAVDQDDDGFGTDTIGAALREGQTVMDAAKKTFGDEQTQTMINQAALSEDMTPPEGMSVAAVGKIISAYTASANETMAHTGIDAAAMSAVLGPNDLRDARLAVIRGDGNHLNAIASKAVDTLASLGHKDPAAFGAFIEGRFGSDIDYKFESGRALVLVEGKGYVPFDTIVRSGWLTKAKAVAVNDE
jgi:hypothetical protein